MKLKIVQDEDPPNPRTENDCFGKIVHWHNRYNFGERIDDPAKWLLGLSPGSLILPLCLLDHSGLHLYIGTGAHACDPGGWDSGPVGFIYADEDAIRKEFNISNFQAIPQWALDKAKKILEQEVKTYDQFLQGDVWGYAIEDDEGNHLDSCWGFFGREYCEEAGREALAHAEKHSFDPVI